MVDLCCKDLDLWNTACSKDTKDYVMFVDSIYFINDEKRWLSVWMNNNKKDLLIKEAFLLQNSNKQGR